MSKKEKLAKILLSQGEKLGNDKLIQLAKKVIPTEPQNNASNHIVQILRNKKDKGTENRQVYDDNGNVIGVRTRSEPIDTKRKIQLYDDRTLEDPVSKLLQPKIKTERSRPPVKKRTVICSQCKKESKVSPVLYRDYFICDRCCRKGVR